MNDQAQALKTSGHLLDQPIGRREAVRRVNRAMDYLNTHLADSLNLELLAAQACFSPNHFVQIFSEMAGETPVEHLRRIRLERAAMFLYCRPKSSVLDIALACGFQSAAVFSRAFRAHFGRSASDWRRGGFWRQCGLWACWRPLPCTECEVLEGSYLELYRAGRLLPIKHKTECPPTLSEIKVETLPPRRIAYMRGTGPYQRVLFPLWRNMTRWAAISKLLKPGTLAVGTMLHVPLATAPRHYHFDVGVVVDDMFVPDRYVSMREIRGGRYVTANFSGRQYEGVVASRYLWGTWIGQHGHVPTGEPGYVILGLSDARRARDFSPDSEDPHTICIPIT